MNIVVSGWPGAGSSTLSLIIAYQLKLKLFQGSKTIRLLGTKLGYTQNGEGRIKADEYLDKYWGPVYDKYVDYALTHKDNYLVESDIAAFRLGLNDNLFSIFLAPSLESRKKRLEVDGRSEDIPLLEEREKKSQAHYLTLCGLDWLDLNIVIQKYNLVLDTSDMKIAQELEYIFEALGKKSKRSFSEIENEFWQKGKDFYLEKLKENDLLIPTEEIIREIVKTFPNDIKNMPLELRDIACNI